MLDVREPVRALASIIVLNDVLENAERIAVGIAQKDAGDVVLIAMTNVLKPVEMNVEIIAQVVALTHVAVCALHRCRSVTVPAILAVEIIVLVVVMQLALQTAEEIVKITVV